MNSENIIKALAAFCFIVLIAALGAKLLLASITTDCEKVGIFYVGDKVFTCTPRVPSRAPEGGAA